MNQDNNQNENQLKENAGFNGQEQNSTFNQPNGAVGQQFFQNSSTSESNTLNKTYMETQISNNEYAQSNYNRVTDFNSSTPNKKNNMLLYIILGLIVFIVLVAIISPSKNESKTSNEITPNNNETTPSNKDDNSNNNTNNSDSESDTIPLNNYGTVGNGVQLKVINTEMASDGYYYYIYFMLNNKSAEDILMFTPSYEKKPYLFYESYMIKKSADLNNISNSDILSSACRIRSITNSDGTVIETTVSTKEDVYIKSGEESKVWISCAIYNAEDRKAGVIPALLEVKDSKAMPVCNFSLR